MNAREAAREDSLDRLFSALSDRNRRAILAQLMQGPATVSEVAEPLQIALPSALKHLAVLETGGFIRSSKEGRVRTLELREDAFRALEHWVAERQRHWHSGFDRLEAQFLSAKKPKNSP